MTFSIVMTAISLHAQSLNNSFTNDPFGDKIFKQMSQMQKQMNSMFEQMQQRINQRQTHLTSPLGTYKLGSKLTFIDKGNHYEMETNIPKSDENNINIKTSGDILSINAKIIHKDKTVANGVTSNSESVQVYQESVSLPKDANKDDIKSKYIDGKLVIMVPKIKVISKKNK